MGKVLVVLGYNSKLYINYFFRIGVVIVVVEKGLLDEEIKFVGRWKLSVF